MPQLLIIALLWLSQSSDTAQTAENAARAMRAGNFAEAVRLYKSLSSQYPSDTGLRLSLTTALYSAGDYGGALHELQAIQAHEGQNAKFWFLFGMTELKLHREQTAVEYLGRSIKLDPANHEAGLELASTLLELHRLSAAEQVFQTLARELPSSPKVWQGLALTEVELSEQALDQLKKIAPRSSYLYGLAALGASESGDTAKAIALYEKALSTPTAPAWMRLELTAVRSGTPGAPCTDATYACRFLNGDVQALAAEVSRLRTPEALYWTSRAYAQLAKQSMSRLAALPPSPEQHQVMARLYARSGHKAEAIQELREACKLSPGAPLFAGDLAEALWADRQYEEAVTLLTPLVAASPTRADWQFELGDALFNLGRPEEAVAHLQQAVAASPELLPAHAKLGEALLRTGDAVAAVAHLEHASSIDHDGSIHFQLAAAYRKVGKMDAASKAMQRRNQLANAATGKPEK